MTGAFRKIAIVVACSAFLGIAVSAAIHAEFEAMKLVLVWGAVVSFILFVASALSSGLPRARSTSRGIARAAIITVLAVPFAFAANPLVFRMDLWRAKRFVAREIHPNLERHRLRSGVYPKMWHLWESPPPGAPWLIRRSSYGSDGRTYGLSVTNPGVCGHVVSYASSTGRWSESYDPCWY